MLKSSYNQAAEFGGVIYYEDAAAYIQCEFNLDGEVKTEELPHCLFWPMFFRFSPPATHLT